MTKMAAMPYIVKTLKYPHLQNQKSYDLETWHEALISGALQMIYRIMENFRVVQFSRNFAVGRGPRKLKFAKFFQVCLK